MGCTGRAADGRAGVYVAHGSLRKVEVYNTGALLAVADHPGYRLLDGASLAGVTLERWTAASATVGTLWQGLDAHKSAVDAAAALRARHPRPGQAELAKITAMLTGPSAELVGADIPLEQRKLAGPERLSVRVTRAHRVTRMNAQFTTVTELVTAADSAWSALMARMMQAEEQLRAAERDIASLGPDLVPDPAAAGQLRQELARIRTAVTTDPLSLWQRGTAQTAPFDRVDAGIGALRDQLTKIIKLRAEFDGRASGIGSTLAAVDTAAAQAQEADARVRERVVVAPATGIARPAGPLHGRLAELRRMRASGDWSGLAVALPSVASDASRALAQAPATLDAIPAPPREHDEMRCPPQAYQAKAAGLGDAEDLELDAIFQQARDLLWTAPCALREAAKALSGYQAAVAQRARVKATGR